MKTLIPTILITSTLPLLASHAQTKEVEELLVEGELRQKPVLEYSNSITLLDDEQIRLRETRNLDDLLNLSPNVNYSTGASRGRFIQIRGIGERSQFVSPINPSVGVIADGIDFTGIATGVTALDAQQVEIFRGPQGTLYGANALAGLINVVGHAPGDEFEGAIALGIGNYDSYTFSAKASIPFSEQIRNRIAIQQFNSDGFIENAFLQREDTNNLDEFSLRNQFAVSLDGFNLSVTSYVIDIDNGYDAFSLDNTRTTLSDQPGHDRLELIANALKIEVDTMPWASWQTIVSHVNAQTEYGYDEDWAFREICAIDSDCAFFQYSTTDNYERDNRNVSLDTRLVSKNANDELNWVLGFYLRNQRVDLLRTQTNNDPSGESFYEPVSNPAFTLYTSEFETLNTALYAQVDIPLTAKLTLVTGLRAEHREADFIDSDGAQFSPEEFLLGGRISLEYQPQDSSLFYALLSRGYKAGGFNADVEVPVENREFDTETMWNYELGYKGNWLDGKFVTQLSAFYQDRKDVQSSQSRGVITAENEPPDFPQFTANAAAGVNYGIEAELLWQVMEQIEIYSAIGLLEADYTKYFNGAHVDSDTDLFGTDQSDVEGKKDLSGRDQAHAPNYQYLLGAHYRINQHVYLRPEIEGKDAFYFSDSHDERSESYALFNLRIGYEQANWSVSLWGKNLNDEDVATRGFYFSNDFGNDPRKFYAPEAYTQLGAPRTFGITGSYQF